MASQPSSSSSSSFNRGNGNGRGGRRGGSNFFSNAGKQNKQKKKTQKPQATDESLNEVASAFGFTDLPAPTFNNTVSGGEQQPLAPLFPTRGPQGQKRAAPPTDDASGSKKLMLKTTVSKTTPVSTPVAPPPSSYADAVGPNPNALMQAAPKDRFVYSRAMEREFGVNAEVVGRLGLSTNNTNVKRVQYASSKIGQNAELAAAQVNMDEFSAIVDEDVNQAPEKPKTELQGQQLVEYIETFYSSGEPHGCSKPRGTGLRDMLRHMPCAVMVKFNGDGPSTWTGFDNVTVKIGD